MRDYSFAGDNELREDGSNLSSVLAKLCKQEQMKQSLLDFIRSLPEQDITDISCYRMRRKTPPFRAGDIRRVRRICVSN